MEGGGEHDLCDTRLGTRMRKSIRDTTTLDPFRAKQGGQGKGRAEQSSAGQGHARAGQGRAEQDSPARCGEQQLHSAEDAPYLTQVGID